jgi:hypothetical protein
VNIFDLHKSIKHVTFERKVLSGYGTYDKISLSKNNCQCLYKHCHILDI